MSSSGTDGNKLKRRLRSSDPGPDDADDADDTEAGAAQGLPTKHIGQGAQVKRFRKYFSRKPASGSSGKEKKEVVDVDAPGSDAESSHGLPAPEESEEQEMAAEGAQDEEAASSSQKGEQKESMGWEILSDQEDPTEGNADKNEIKEAASSTAMAEDEDPDAVTDKDEGDANDEDDGDEGNGGDEDVEEILDDEDADGTMPARGPKATDGASRYRVSQSELNRLGATGKKNGPEGLCGIYPPGRPKIEDDRESKIPARSLNVELTCPICLSIVRNTHTFMECLHRFCQECIEKYLRMGTKECPKCRMKVSSRRALRPDPQFDKLVEAFYPDRDAFEEKEEEFISKVNAGSAQLAAAVEEGLKRQAQASGRAEVRGKAVEAVETTTSPAAAASTEEVPTPRSQPQAASRDRERDRAEEPIKSSAVKKAKVSSTNKKSFLKKKPSMMAGGTLAASGPKFKSNFKPNSDPSKKKVTPKSKPVKADPVSKGDTDSTDMGGVGSSMAREMNTASSSHADEQQEDYTSPPVTPPPPPSIFSRRSGIVEFRLWPHPGEKRVAPLPKDYMCSLESCPMIVIKKYLAKRYLQDDYKAFDLLINTTEQDNAVIPNDITLGTVVRMLWSRYGELKILFRTSPHFKLSPAPESAQPSPTAAKPPASAQPSTAAAQPSPPSSQPLTPQSTKAFGS